MGLKVSVPSFVVAVVYIGVATAVAYVLAAGDVSAWAASTAFLGLAALMGIAVRAAWASILPFAPLAMISLGVVLSGGRTAGWVDLWFFDLLVLALLGAILVLLERRACSRGRRMRAGRS
jgi:hypothetical protein